MYTLYPIQSTIDWRKLFLSSINITFVIRWWRCERQKKVFSAVFLKTTEFFFSNNFSKNSRKKFYFFLPRFSQEQLEIYFIFSAVHTCTIVTITHHPLKFTTPTLNTLYPLLTPPLFIVTKCHTRPCESVDQDSGRGWSTITSLH